MSHELDMTTGDAAFAFTGDRAMIWHELGTELPEGASEDQWIDGAKLRWTVERAHVSYQPENEHWLRDLPEQHVLYRSDTKGALAVVSKDFKVVQPIDQFKFFERFCELAGAKLSTAGALFGGRQLFASAEIGGDIRIVGSDVLRPIIMFHTANDGSSRTTIRNVSTRPVCNNTVSAAMAESKLGLIAVSHRTKFSPIQAADEMAAWVQTQVAMAEQFKLLAQTPVSRKTADLVVFDLLNDKRAAAKVAEPGSEPAKFTRDIRNGIGFKTIMELFDGKGRGAGLPGVRGTAWGLMNAVTEYADHHQRAKTDSHRWASAQFGAGKDLKDKVYNRLMEIATAE